MMYMVQVPKGLMPIQVDDFPEGCKRSCKGGLHFRKDSTKRITEDEYNHVLKSPKHQAFGKRLLVVHKGESKLEVARKAEEAKAPPKPKAEAKAAEAPKGEPKADPKAAKKTKAPS